MKASKFTDAHKAFIIRQGENGTPVDEICRKAGNGPANYFNWKKKYAGPIPSEMKRLQNLRTRPTSGRGYSRRRGEIRTQKAPRASIGQMPMSVSPSMTWMWW